MLDHDNKCHGLFFRECDLHRYVTDFIRDKFNQYIHEQMSSRIKSETEGISIHVQNNITQTAMTEYNNITRVQGHLY